MRSELVGGRLQYLALDPSTPTCHRLRECLRVVLRRFGALAVAQSLDALSRRNVLDMDNIYAA